MIKKMHTDFKFGMEIFSNPSHRKNHNPIARFNFLSGNPKSKTNNI